MNVPDIWHVQMLTMEILPRPFTDMRNIFFIFSKYYFALANYYFVQSPLVCLLSDNMGRKCASGTKKRGNYQLKAQFNKIAWRKIFQIHHFTGNYRSQKTHQNIK